MQQALFFSIDSANWIGRMGSIAVGLGLVAIGLGLFFQKRAEGGSKSVHVTQRTIGVALAVFGVGVSIVGWQAFPAIPLPSNPPIVDERFKGGARR